MVGIIDYGAGNLSSVKKALDYLNIKNKIVSEVESLKEVTKLIFPGVGAMGRAIEKLKSEGLYFPLKEWVLCNKPFLGICLGMQLLFEESEESSEVSGFGFFKGKVHRFRKYKVPQIGWNQVKIIKNSIIMEGIRDNSYFYFLHGYFACVVDKSIVVGETEYGVNYPSVVEQGNIYGVQFHPEKSGTVGLKLLNNWVKLC